MLKFKATLSEHEFICIRYSMEKNLERALTMNVFTERQQELRKLREYVLWCIKMSTNAVRGILHTTNTIHLSTQNAERMNKEDSYIRWFIEHRSRLDDIIRDLCQRVQQYEKERLRRRRVVMIYPSKVIQAYQPPHPVVCVDEKHFTEEDAVEAMVDGRSMKRERGYRKN